MVKKRNLAIIPARGGSKRIPNKNIITILDKPLIAWTIEAAINSNIFDRIIVSTDSQLIAETAIRYGAEVPFLRSDKADDFSTISEATIFSLNQIKDLNQYEYVTQLMAVCPLRDEVDIVNAFNFFIEKDNKLQISCFKYGFMNPWWAFTLDKNNQPNKLFSNTMVNSQHLPELYCPTGAIWIADIKELLKLGTFYGCGHKYWEINWKNGIDIDNYEDLELAEFLLHKKSIK